MNETNKLDRDSYGKMLEGEEAYVKKLVERIVMVTNLLEDNKELKAQVWELTAILESVCASYIDNHPEEGEWWCAECEEYLSTTRVTYDETCDICGGKCEWHHITDMDKRITLEALKEL